MCGWRILLWIKELFSGTKLADTRQMQQDDALPHIGREMLCQQHRLEQLQSSWAADSFSHFSAISGFWASSLPCTKQRECSHVFPCSRLWITHKGAFESLTRCVYPFQICSGKALQLRLFPPPSWLKGLDANSSACNSTYPRCWPPAIICPQAVIKH